MLFVTVHDKHTKPRFKRKLVEVKFNDGICTEIYASSPGLKATGIFIILLSHDGFESDFSETKFQKITF